MPITLPRTFCSPHCPSLLPGVPVISEEQAAANNLPQTDSLYFVVDPLDGTKEFLKLNGEFCINVGLVSGEKAIFGLIFAPAKADCFVTLGPGQAYRCELHPAHNPPPANEFDFTRLNGEAADRPFTAIVSRSHLRPDTLAFLDEPRKSGKEAPRVGAEIRPAGHRRG